MQFHKLNIQLAPRLENRHEQHLSINPSAPFCNLLRILHLRGTLACNFLFLKCPNLASVSQCSRVPGNDGSELWPWNPGQDSVQRQWAQQWQLKSSTFNQVLRSGQQKHSPRNDGSELRPGTQRTGLRAKEDALVGVSGTKPNLGSRAELGAVPV